MRGRNLDRNGSRERRGKKVFGAALSPMPILLSRIRTLGGGFYPAAARAFNTISAYCLARLRGKERESGRSLAKAACVWCPRCFTRSPRHRDYIVTAVVGTHSRERTIHYIRWIKQRCIVLISAASCTRLGGTQHRLSLPNSLNSIIVPFFRNEKKFYYKRYR